MDDELLRSLLNDTSPLGLQPSPPSSPAAGHGFTPQIKAEEAGVLPNLSSAADWFKFAGATFQQADDQLMPPLLSSNPLAGALPLPGPPCVAGKPPICVSLKCCRNCCCCL